jgi:serine/threonine protein phosphatase 1
MAADAGSLRFLQSPGRLPRGRRVYAIGDVHGHADKLRRLHAVIAADMAARPVQFATLVHLGDYIDLGPDSAGVIALLVDGPAVPGLRVVNLMGDHERMLLDAMKGDRAAATDWLWAGGREALQSWGLEPDTARERWEHALPAAHVAFLRGLSLMHRDGEYVFVHAGIRPGVALEAQAADDLVTMRQPFLWSEDDFGFIVVHGHSSAPSVTIGKNRIALDTGAGLGEKLTCAVLEDDVIGLIAV